MKEQQYSEKGTERISRKDVPPISEYSGTSNCITV